MESSEYWSGTTVGDATLAPYDDDEFSDNWALLHTYDRTTQGVINTANPTYSSMLACTNPSGTTIRVANGAALVDGKIYKNTANVDFSVTAPGAGTNYYTIVLRKSFAAQTVRLVLLGPDAVSFPTVTQNDGTTWEIALWTVSITNASVITITDVRVFSPTIYSDNIANNSVTDTKLRDSAALSVIGRATNSIGDPADITAETDHYVLRRSGGSLGFGLLSDSNIQNRTRTFLVPASTGYDTTTPANLIATSTSGVLLEDNKDSYAIFSFMCPADFVSDLTISPICISDASGNANVNYVATYGAIGEASNTHSDNDAVPVKAITAALLTEFLPLTLTNISIGDYVGVVFQRNGTQATDTINNDMYVLGLMVKYTADS